MGKKARKPDSVWKFSRPGPPGAAPGRPGVKLCGETPVFCAPGPDFGSPGSGGFIPEPLSQNNTQPTDMADFIPDPDPAFDAYAAQLVSAVTTDPAAFGETLASLAGLNAALAAWGVAYPNALSAQATAAAAIAAKNSTRAPLESEIRQLNARVQARRAAVTPAAKQQAGLPVYDSTKTPVGIPQTAPLLQADTSKRLKHTISFRDAENPDRRGKPDGVFGCTLYLKIGSPPANLEDATFIALDTATPYSYDFEPEDAGKTAYWIACWVNRTQDHGPCSETVAATITG